MYQPPHHREDRLDVQHALIRAHPLGALVTLGASGLTASHIPFLIDPAASPLGTLRAHVARANAQWRDFDPKVEALVIFQGPESYITPAWYETKRETGKVVPTWNYAVVHAYGAIRTDRGRGPAARARHGADEHARARARGAVGGHGRAGALRRRPAARHRRARDRHLPHRGQVEGQPEPARRRPHRRDEGPAGAGRRNSDMAKLVEERI